MNIIRSISSRIESLRNDRKSRYWEYAAYYADSQLWADVILFESFGGANFQGNPYYIYKHILRDVRCEKYRFFIAHKNPAQLLSWLQERGLIDDRVTVIEKDTSEYRNTLSHAKYLVNNVSFNMDFIKKPGQVYLNTWHGTPLKCLGRNIRNDPFECNNAQRNFLLCDHLIAPNILTKRVYEEDYMVHGIMPGKIHLQGYPRNSVFFDAAARVQVRKKYSIENVTAVFFMPTWRGTACGIDDVDQVSQIEQLAKDLGDGYRVYVKFHPAMQKAGHDFKFCHNMPQDIEAYEFLNGMDILITDYSSVFFDFASAGQKIVLYQYDKEQYYQSRGVYDEVADNLPFPVAYCYEELLAAVKAEKDQQYPEFIERFCAWDSLMAAAEAAELLTGEVHEENATDSVDLYVIDFAVEQEQLLRWKETLTGTNYRFVFVQNRRARGLREINVWDQLSYMALYTGNRLTLREKLKYHLCYAIKAKCTLKAAKALALREQRRLWGNMKVGRIYAKSRNLPVAVQPFAQKWPKDLK